MRQWALQDLNQTNVDHLLKNFRRLNEPVFCCAAETVVDDDDDDDADDDDDGFCVKTCLASRCLCFMSLSCCLRSRSNAALMSFSCFLSWSRSLLELTPSDYTQTHRIPMVYIGGFKNLSYKGAFVTIELLSRRRFRRSMIGRRAFPIAGARVWNDLPSDVMSAPSPAVFGRRLKTELFRRCYNAAWLFFTLIVVIEMDFLFRPF